MLKSGSDGVVGEKITHVTLWTKNSEQKQKVHHTKQPLKHKTKYANFSQFQSSLTPAIYNENLKDVNYGDGWTKLFIKIAFPIFSLNCLKFYLKYCLT